jgi:hypothetical protein
MVVGFTTICAIGVYPHYSCEFEFRSWCGVPLTTLCHKVCSDLWQVNGFSPGTPVSSTNKTDRHDITEIVESGVKHHKPNPTIVNFLKGKKTATENKLKRRNQS